MQQSGYDEMQLLQQQVMLRQLHALQMQQQNFSNPFSSTAQKQANSSRQFPPVLAEMPLNDSSQGYLNWAQGNATPGQQGTLSRNMFSMGLGSQQPDISPYGAPATNARGNMGQQPPIQVMYQEPGSLVATPPSGQTQKSFMQLSNFNNPFLNSHYDSSPPQLPLQQGTFMSNLGVQGRGMSEVGSVNFGNILPQQADSSPKDSSVRQEEQASWSSFQQKDTTKPSQGLVPLDPLEEKILFSMEDSSISEIASGVFGDKFDTVNFSSPFPSSMQSGSWSALMQTAVAEASTSDTGLPEEFSGLTYQNMEISADINDISNFIDSDKQQPVLVNTNTLLGSSSLNSSFPGFQVPSNQLRPGLFQDDSTPVSTQRSSNVTGHWVDCNPQPKISRIDNLSTGNMYMQPSGMFDQLQSQTGINRSSTAPSSASHLVGMSSLVPRQLGQAGMFPQFIQQNDPSTVSVSQVQTTNPSVASFPGNATLPGVNLDPGLGGHTTSQTRDPQRGTSQQFNVWMDLPTRQHLLDQESWQKAQPISSTGYNMQQRIGLPQEQGAAATYNSGFTASNKDFNKLPMDSGMSSMSQLKTFAFPGSKMEQMGASRNDQMQPTHDSRETPGQLPQHSKPLNTANKHAEIIASKKRKLMRTEKLAWHKEVSNASKRDRTVSEAEPEWAKVANFLPEKAEYVTHTFEFAPPLHRSKRRLVITSQLIQQLFDPPSSLLLFSKASSSYDVLCFFIARATLGDACTLTHKGDNGLPSSSYEVENIPKKIEDVQHSEVAKSLTEKANKLKESFERLEKTPSMAEIKLDIEDLERFSVINRFARFHSKGPVSGNPSQSTLLKPMPQRYVAVGPMPQSIPEGVQCISL